MKVKKENNGYRYIELLSDSHDHKKIKIWINDRILSEVVLDDNFIFPVLSAQVIKTEKEELVLCPGQGYVYYIKIVSGYRGYASIDKVVNGEIVCQGSEYHSGQGALGKTAWAIVNSSSSYIEMYGTRSGKQIDQNIVKLRLKPDGSKEEIIDDDLKKIMI